MATKKRKNTGKNNSVSKPKNSKTNDGSSAKLEQRKQLDEQAINARLVAAKELHFIPLLLQFSILVCSGTLAVMSYRDVFGTGKVIFGQADNAMLEFTRSTKWFDESKGWKSSQGGFSAVQQITSDENDMGGFFVRKLAGAAALSFHLQKLVPIVFQSSKSHWGLGHFTPMLATSIVGNLTVAAYYMSYIADLKRVQADTMAYGIVLALVVESIIIMGYIISLALKKEVKLKEQKLPNGKTPNSLVSNIVARTTCIVSGQIALIAGRDFFFPGQELHYPPYDGIYLEWTGAFIHSPPPGTIEGEEYGLEAGLHIGDKFISRLCALYVLILCFQKFSSALLIRIGKDNSGQAKTRLFWRVQAASDGLILFVFRVFGPSAKSASLDFRWHVMCLGYELFILGLYGFN